VTIRHADGETIAISKEAEEDTGFKVQDIPDGRELSYSTVANGIGGALNDLDLDDVRPAQQVDAAVVTEFETFDGLNITVETIKTDDENWISLAASSADEAGDEAADINGRLTGWQYRVADYKANLLMRRWEDILKTDDADE
jgi:hypothetical protein